MTDTAAEFRAAALELREADRQMYLLARRNIRLATAPARAAVVRSALETLPRAGGLNRWVADAAVKTSVLVGSRSAGVRVTASRTGHDLVSINDGQVRHPTFGQWQSGVPAQSVTPGFFTKPLDELSGAVTVACYATMDEVSVLAGFG